MNVLTDSTTGTRYLKNYGRNSSVNNATVYASNHTFHNGTDQLTPCQIVHTSSRASTATYRDGGLLKYAAIDEERYQDGIYLMEAAATNLCDHSQDFSTADWIIFPTASCTKSIEATRYNPDGTAGVHRMTCAGSLTSFGIYNTAVNDIISSSTQSCWIRANRTMNIWVGVDISAYNHTVTTEWTRVSHSALAISANFMIKAQGETFSTSDWFEVFGAQSEVGSLTSYIPTTTTTATRAADVVTLPTASYFIYSDTASKSIKQLSSTGNYATNIPLNDDFNNGLTTGWTATPSASIAGVSGIMRVTLQSTTNPGASKAISTIPGRTYAASVDISYSSVSSNRFLRAGTTIYGNDLMDKVTTGSSLSGTFIATGTTTYITVVNIASVIGDYTDWDNVYVREALPVSAQYQLTSSFQYAIAATAPLSTEDIAYIDANPEALYDVQFNSLVLPSGFSSTDITYFYDGTQGALGSDTVWNIARKFTSRASTGTYIDGGVLKYAAIDEARYEDGFLLSEVAGTNQCLYSEDFTNVAWAKTPNTIASPDGAITASTLTKAAATFAAMGQFFTVTPGIKNGFFFLKAGSLTKASIMISENGTAVILSRAVVNLIDGTFVVRTGNISDFKVEYISSGWWKVSVNAIGTLTDARLYIYPDDYLNAIAGDIYIWGAQFSYVLSSYIPTTTTSATRAADLPYANDVKIVNYTTACNTTFTNESYGATSIKLIKDPYGRTYGAAAANDSYWASDSRQAVTNWTISAPFTVTEVCDGVTYTFTSDGNRYADGVADGTYTLPTGTWTLDDTAFDDVTSVSVRGNTQMINEVVIP